MAENQLVLQSDQEKLLVRLESFKKNNLTRQELEAVKAMLPMFHKTFHNLSWEMFGVSETDLSSLSYEEMGILGDMVAKKARLWATPQNIFWFVMFFIPVVGWIAVYQMKTNKDLDGNDRCILFNSHRYLRVWKALKRVYGKDYFLHIKKI